MQKQVTQKRLLHRIHSFLFCRSRGPVCSAGLLRAEGVRHEKRVGHVRSKLGQARPSSAILPVPSEFELEGWKKVLFWEYFYVVTIVLEILKFLGVFSCVYDDSSPTVNINEVQLGEWQPDSCSPSEQRDCACRWGGLQPRSHLVKRSNLVEAESKLNP